uniref:major antigen-like isoform X2 n=1 Tax=Gasterosteus aculeatus aculeatus TaxID=481459 RepID=UPI001A9897B2|nr:major antigen-like isoform X2 [Gasterosteus aculeatus aculeatus]
MFNCTMRVVLGLLLVLLGLCGSAAQQDGFTKVGEIGEFPETAARDTADESIEDTTKQTRHDIWAELRALKDTVSDVRVELYLLQRDNADLQTRLSSGERELLVSKFRVDLLEKENADLQTRLSSSESELLVSKFRIDQVEKENAVQETRLNATESQTSGLEGEITDLQTRLSSSESELLFSKSRIDQLGKENADLQTRLSSSESELLVSKSRIDQLEKENAVQETRLNATEIQTSGLKGKITDLQTRLSSSESELLVSKSRIDQLEKENAVQETRLNTTEIQTSGLEGEITDLQTRLSSSQSELLVSESRIDQLEKENAEKPKVAFYTALTDAGQVGPYNADVTLKYSKVFTNIGNAYSPSTGFFTAPVKGAYYLQFTAASYRTGYMGVQVFKNNQRIMFNGEFMDGSAYKYLTNSVVLELIAGDEVHLVLPPNNYLQDTSDNHNTFSGALLFPL